MVRTATPAHRLFGLLLVTALIAGCQDKNKLVQPPPPEVTVSRPTRAEVQGYLEFTGNTQAVVTVQLTARVQGYLQEVLFHDGDTVDKDQVLFIIEQAPYKAKLQQAEGQVLQVQAQLAHAETELARFSDLRRQNAAAQTDVENWRFQRDNARAALLQARAARDLAQLDVSYTRVTAPFTGRIDRRTVDPGNLVGAGGNTVLATISKIDPMYVYFTINETQLLQRINATGLTPGQVVDRKVRVDLGLANDPGYPYQGVLDFTGISVNATTGSLLLRAVFPNAEGKLLPGLFARLRAHKIDSEREAVLVPETAMGYDQQGAYVLLVNSTNTVERHSVAPGATFGERWIIDQGLQGDEWVVVSGLLRAIPGTVVTPVRQPSASTAQGPRLDRKG